MILAQVVVRSMCMVEKYEMQLCWMFKGHTRRQKQKSEPANAFFLPIVRLYCFIVSFFLAVS